MSMTLNALLRSLSETFRPGVQPDPYLSTENYGNYVFRYVWEDASHEKVKIYIENQPSYGSRDTDANVIHRLKDAGAPSYICIKEAFKPTTFSAAQDLAHRWADMTETYIRTGKTISEQIGG